MKINEIFGDFGLQSFIQLNFFHCKSDNETLFCLLVESYKCWKESFHLEALFASHVKVTSKCFQGRYLTQKLHRLHISIVLLESVKI